MDYPKFILKTRGENPSEYKRGKQLPILDLIKGNKREDNLQNVTNMAGSLSTCIELL